MPAGYPSRIAPPNEASSLGGAKPMYESRHDTPYPGAASAAAESPAAASPGAGSLISTLGLIALLALVTLLLVPGAAHAQQSTDYEPAPYEGQTANPSPQAETGDYEAPEYSSSPGSAETTTATDDQYNGVTSGELADTSGPPPTLMVALGAYLLLVGAAVFAGSRRSGNARANGPYGTRD